MENDTSTGQNTQAYITRYAMSNWTATTIWAILFSGLGLLVTIVWAVVYYLNLDKLSMIAERAELMDSVPVLKIYAANIQWILLTFIALSGTMHVFHLRYAIDLRHAISQEHQERFETAWSSLRHFFRIQSILTVVVFVFYTYTTYQYIMLYRKMLNMMQQMN